MTSENPTVIISGAGPAGTATAAALVRQGVPAAAIRVYERCKLPRVKPCGGGLTGRIDQALTNVGLKLQADHHDATEAVVRFGGLTRRVKLRHPVKIVRREQFDYSLVEQVRALGVEVVEQTGIVDFTTEADGISVTTSRGDSLKAAVLVGADGAASVVRKRLLGRKRRLPHRLFQAEVKLREGSPAGDFDGMLFDFTPMIEGLRGYLWLFPVPGESVNVGLMHAPASRIDPRELTAMLSRHLEPLGLELTEQSARGWPLWGYEPDTTVAMPRVLTVGDAAGINALTGEGIAIAIEQAALAAESITDAVQRNEFSLESYVRRLRSSHVGRELSLDGRIAKVLYGPLWRVGLSLALLDRDMMEAYGARLDGSLAVSTHAQELYKAAVRHSLLGVPRLFRVLSSEWSGRHRKPEPAWLQTGTAP